MSWMTDLTAVLRGLEKVKSALFVHQQRELQLFWKNSSLRLAAEDVCQRVEEKFSDAVVRTTSGKSVEGPNGSSNAKLGFEINDPQVESVPKTDSSQPTAKLGESFKGSQQALLSNLPSNAWNSRRTFSTGNGLWLKINRKLYSTAPSSNGSGKKSKPIATEFKSELNDQAKESKVPGSRISRLISFGGLGAGLALGTLSEAAKKSFTSIKPDSSGAAAAVAILDRNPLLSEANAERIVSTLCRVRGAALKLGQMISIQDNSLINPELQRVFERVRQSADFMPVWQMEEVMTEQMGASWKSKLAEFDSKPFAAASIGQVHRGKLQDGRQVAVKIQYPGVAKSINSDIDNLMALLKFWQILPEGLYAKNALKVAKRELAWECDYVREAKCSEKFREIFKDDPVFYIPEVIWDLTTKQVLTTELVRGESLDKLVNSDQKTRNWICENLLRLCLHELFIFNFMQTDPNWSNFLYDTKNEQITLLDFGATRDFSRKFTDTYIEVIKAASVGDQQGVLDGSKKLGFLTGFESKVMEKAHVDAVMILGEAFADEKPFDFGKQSTAGRIHSLIPVMLKHRLTPPPEETYSLHRKMSGCFLLCTKLGARISCKPLFDDVWNKYHQRKLAETAS